MPNQVTLTFAGDPGNLPQASRKAAEAVEQVGTAATQAGNEMTSAAQDTAAYTDRVGQLGAGITGMTDAVDSAGAAVQGLVDIQNASRERAMKLARAQADVEQAMLDGKQAAIDLEQATVDLKQAQQDGRQAAIDERQAQIDVTQAQLDATVAFKAYNDAVDEFGAGSAEAKQAQIDLNQARLDEGQALADADQARIDANQSLVDSKQFANDATQAVRDGKDAQLDLNDAMHEANPSGLQQWADKINLITPILSGLVGVVGLVTAAQWAWNAAQLASPTTWIIAGIAAVIAIIVVIATKTTWFQQLWKSVWGGVKDAAAAVGNWFQNTFYRKWILGAFNGIKEAAGSVVGWFRSMPGKVGAALGGLAQRIISPYRSAFNAIASLWNNTVGRLSFTIPGWVPGIGGNSFNVPNIPRFHSGAPIGGTPGSETMAILQAGERVLPATSSIGNAGPVLLGSDGSALGDLLIDVIALAMKRRAGDPAAMGLRV
jgi:hypothetical protein